MGAAVHTLPLRTKHLETERQKTMDRVGVVERETEMVDCRVETLLTHGGLAVAGTPRMMVKRMERVTMSGYPAVACVFF